MEKEKNTIDIVQLREAELEELYLSSLEKIKSSEIAEQALRQEYGRTQDELALQEQEVLELERRVRDERRSRAEEVGELEARLSLETKSREDEANKNLKHTSEMRQELKKVCVYYVRRGASD